ncbi:hypothetical protein JA9_001214 [Meyerozyma sp. JA9]|nr:hypothetical protein JA9_001214 [Meyerozyma sp. JA9]
MFGHIQRPFFRLSCRILVRNYIKPSGIDSSLISSSDLHHGLGTFDTSDKVGPIPASSATTSGYFDHIERLYSEEKLEMHHTSVTTMPLIKKLESDPTYSSFLKPRMQKIRRFVSSNFDLSNRECLAIMCGRSPVDVHLDNQNPQPLNQEQATGINSKSTTASTAYSSEKLHSLGIAIMESYLTLTTLFTDESYLSLSSDDLQPIYELFCDRQIIPEFMSLHRLDDCVVPYRGATRGAKLDSLEEYKTERTKIMNATSAASFYTLIGLLCVKYDQRQVAQSFILPTVLYGPRGLIQLATEKVTK